MKIKTMLVCLTTILMMLTVTGKTEEKPPLMKAKPVVDEYFGKKISDPFRNMEDLQDPEVMQWIKSQSAYSRSILTSIPGRQFLINKMREFDKRKPSNISWLRITNNDQYFYLKTMPDEDIAKLFWRDGYQGSEYLLFDPQTFNPENNKTYLITNISPSDDGSKIFFVLYPLDQRGNNIFITMDVKSKKILEQIDMGWMSIASWLPGGNGYLINLPDETPNKERKIFFHDSRICLHIIGTDSNEDKEVFSRSKYPELQIKPEDIPMVRYDKNSHYIFCTLASSDRRRNVFYAPASDLSEEKMDWKHLFKREDEVYNFVATDKELYVRTPKEAPNFKIMKTSLKNPDLADAEVVIPENPQATLTSFRLTSEGIYFILTQNGIKNKLHYQPYEEEAVEIDLPYTSTQISIESKGIQYSDVWVQLSGWTGNQKRYRYLLEENEFHVENLSKTTEHPEYGDLIVEYLMIPSHDGVEVPLSLIYKEGIKKNGKNHVLLYGYGAYGALMTSIFDPNMLLWTYEGGILAIAHVRGGGELGHQWHKAGLKTTKPNTWKDLIACAEYLIAENYTRNQKIAINSRSAGGILIGRAMTERPDLFAVAIPEVGLLNSLRLEKLQISPYQVNEFGNVKDLTECMALIEMDPYLHLKADTKYPATLITAGMLDPMIPTWMPAKFAARLQSVNASDKPILFWADSEATHQGITKSQQFEAMAEVLCFALWQTGHPKYQKE